jgi:hypothetical protein
LLMAYFLLAFPPMSYMQSSWPHSCYIPCPSVHSNYTWRRKRVMKLLSMQFGPASLHFIPLRSKYSPQHPVLKHPQYARDRVRCVRFLNGMARPQVADGGDCL